MSNPVEEYIQATSWKVATGYPDYICTSCGNVTDPGDIEGGDLIVDSKDSGNSSFRCECGGQLVRSHVLTATTKNPYLVKPGEPVDPAQQSEQINNLPRSFNRTRVPSATVEGTSEPGNIDSEFPSLKPKTK